VGAAVDCTKGQFKNSHFTEMCSGSEAGSYLRLVDSCITQLKAQGPSRTCNERKEEEEASRGTPRGGTVPDGVLQSCEPGERVGQGEGGALL